MTAREATGPEEGASVTPRVPLLDWLGPIVCHAVVVGEVSGSFGGWPVEGDDKEEDEIVAETPACKLRTTNVRAMSRT